MCVPRNSKLPVEHFLMDIYFSFWNLNLEAFVSCHTKMMRTKKLEMHTCRKLKNDFSLLLLFPPNPLSRRNIFDFQINARGPPVLYIIHGASQVIVCHHSSPFQSFFRSPFYQRSSSIYFSNIFWQSKYMDEEKNHESKQRLE